MAGAGDPQALGRNGLLQLLRDNGSMAPAEVLGRVQYGHERVVVTRHGKEVAAVVSIEDAHLLERLEDLLDVHDALTR